VDVAEWQKRLTDTFSQRGVVGGALIEVLKAESAYYSFVTDKFHGHLVIMDSFGAFSIETLRLAETQYRVAYVQQNKRYKWYSRLLIDYVMNFKRVRATENLLLCGYPTTGYALLRDLKDQTVFISGITRGDTTVERLDGLHAVRDKPITDTNMNLIHKAREREENQVLDKTIRKKSGLDPNHQAKLKKWEQMFNLEVHGSRLSYAKEALPWAQGKAPLPILPRAHEEGAVMYLNRAIEVSWLILRTYPLLQLDSASFGSEWMKKWKVLDDSFRFSVDSLENMGKPIASAIKHLLERKFDFSPEVTHYRPEFGDESI
jgi:hypothetical protein